MQNSGRERYCQKGYFVRGLYRLLIGISLFAMAGSLFRREYSDALIGLLTLGLYGMPRLTERWLGIWFPDLFEGLVLLFIFATGILGEVYCFYQRVPHWDSFLHGASGFLLAAFGLSLFFLMGGGEKLSGSLLMVVFCLCFSMTVGVFWEFFEFGSDMIFHTDMQKDTYIGDLYTVLLDEDNSNTVVSVRGMEQVSLVCVDEGVRHERMLDGYIDIGLYDTMKDLAVNFWGALVFSLVFWQKKGIADRLIPKVNRGVA